MSKPKIYLWCVAMGTGNGVVNGSTVGGDVQGMALAEDGTGLASHWSSSSGFAKHDMGLTSNWKHEIYRGHYPDGFDLEWIDEKDLDAHEGFQRAWALNEAKAKAAEQGK